MTTYYIRSHKTGNIVNAVETDSFKRAQEVADALMKGRDEPLGFYADPNPPLSVLQRYRYWDERP